jgi:hypothetical protein
MTTTLSTYALEAMGFNDVLSRGSLVASFMSVTVYEVRGITLPERFADARESRVAGASYRIALAKNVNDGSQRLIGEDFVASESAWLQEVKAVGPFVLIAVGPTDFIKCEAGRMMRMPDNSITTYDSFSSLRETLKSLEDRVLPPVVATLTLAFNQPDRYVALRKLARASVGRMPDGTTVHDIRIDVRAELTVSRQIEDAQAAEVLDASVKCAPKLHQRSAKYFALGAAEDDQLKKFLYFFLSLEVETHAVFGRIDHSQILRNHVFRDGTSSPRRSVVDLINRDVAQWDNLFDRFVWCAACVWTTLVDEDIGLFKELKSARDAIAHGRKSEPPAGFARKAELLAHKVLWVHGANAV